MSDSPINLHRSFGGLVVGNVLAIFVSGIVCIFVWQATHPVFFKELHEFIQSQKKIAKQKDVEKKKADAKDGEPAKKADEKEKENQDEQLPTKPDFPITILGLTLFIDVVFCAIAGFTCVKIAGFARNNHGMLMAVFILVWKIQQLVGFVSNQIPATLLLMELVALPIACIFGASLAGENDSDAEEESDNEDKSDV